MSILVVAAHPDDEVLGCGGTIAQAEDDVYIAILGEGITSRYANRNDADQALIHTLHGHSQTVADMLGAKDLYMMSLPDNRFDQVPLLDVVKLITPLVDDLKPHTIYTHHPGDLNIDHLITHRAVLTATRPMVGCPVKDIYTFEVPSSTEWAFQRLERPFTPNVFVDIQNTIETKVAGMGVYEIEARPFPHPRSPEALRTIAKRWGTVVGLDYVEAFELIRSIR